MNNHRQHLRDAMVAFNRAERAEFMLATATRWLDLDGPTFLLGDIRVKTLFEDIHGRHWVDAQLAVESLDVTFNLDPRHLDDYRDLAVDAAAATDLWVCTETRGLWNATMAPVNELALTWGYPPPVRLPDGDWARTWLDLTTRTDEQELAWIANGGQPTATYIADGPL